MRSHKPIHSRIMAVFLVCSALGLPLAGSGAEGERWVRKAAMPTARHGVCSCALNGKIYAIGGVNHPGIDVEVLRTVEEYDPATDSWATKADMPTSRNWAACATVNGKIYVLGGDRTFLSSPRRTVEEYDPVSDTWTAKADMPTARSAFVAAAVDEKIYAIGGLTTLGAQALGVVEVYDPATDRWERRANMPTPRGMAGAAVIDGKVFVVGSFLPPSGPSLAVVEMYDPEADVWTRKESMSLARGGLGCGAIQGRIYAVGGRSGNALLATVEEYNPVTDTWVERIDMADADTETPDQRWGLAASELNGRLYAMGGAALFQPPYTTLPVLMEYAPPGPSATVHLQAKPVTREGETYLQLEWPSRAGFLDRLQTRSQVQSTGWTDLEGIPGSGKILTREVPVLGASAFYRLQRDAQ